VSDTVRDAADFIDTTLQNEGAWYRAEDVESRVGGVLSSYGASVGACGARSVMPARSSRALAMTR
jgi:hypothetical protein